jgi:hypothetical protein
MSKRRNRSKEPNLPEATLQRAREQAGLPTPPADAQPDTPPAADAPSLQSVLAAPKPAPRASTRKRIEAASLERSRKRGQLDADTVEAMLANPTKIVTEAELRAEYSHVLVDLRNMGLLAAVLVVVLVIMAQVI